MITQLDLQKKAYQDQMELEYVRKFYEQQLESQRTTAALNDIILILLHAVAAGDSPPHAGCLGRGRLRSVV